MIDYGVSHNIGFEVSHMIAQLQRMVLCLLPFHNPGGKWTPILAVRSPLIIIFSPGRIP